MMTMAWYGKYLSYVVANTLKNKINHDTVTNHVCVKSMERMR